MQPVGQLDDDDPRILGHRYKHLAQVLGVLFLHRLVVAGGGVGQLVELGDLGLALDDLAHRCSEALLELLRGGLGILHGVVEQPGHQGFGVQAQLG